MSHLFGNNRFKSDCNTKSKVKGCCSGNGVCESQTRKSEYIYDHVDEMLLYRLKSLLYTHVC